MCTLLVTNLIVNFSLAETRFLITITLSVCIVHFTFSCVFYSFMSFIYRIFIYKNVYRKCYFELTYSCPAFCFKCQVSFLRHLEKNSTVSIHFKIQRFICLFRVLRYYRNDIDLEWSREVQIMFLRGQGSAELSQETTHTFVIGILGKMSFGICHLK